MAPDWLRHVLFCGSSAPPETSDPPADDVQCQVPTICWLKDLPPELMHTILRHSGRSARLVCRHFHAAYGPLTGGLLLTPPTSTSSIFVRLTPPLPTSPTRDYSQLHTLVIYRKDVAPAHLAHACPTLRALHVAVESRSWNCNNLTALAPLSRTLTLLSITLHHTDTHQGLTTLAAALPNLRSLRLHYCCYRMWDGQPTSSTQLASVLPATASCLPHLQDLELLGTHSYLSNEVAFRDIADSLPQLTRLSLTVDRFFAAGSAAALGCAWPHLADLEIRCEDLRAVPDGAAAAIAQLTALTRLAISGGFIGEATPDLQLLAALPLRELHALRRYGTPCQVAAAAAQMGTVTKLALDCKPWPALTPDDELAGHLSLLADSLLSLDLQGNVDGAHLLHLTCLSRLQDLTLGHNSDSCQRDVAAGRRVETVQAASALAARLPQLRCLRMTGVRQPHVARPLVAGLAAHGMLRELHISYWTPQWPAALAGLAGTLARLTTTCVDPQHLPLVTSSLQGLERLRFLGVWEDVHGHVGVPVRYTAVRQEFGGLSKLRRAWVRGGEAWVLPPRLAVLELRTQNAYLVPVQGPSRDCWVRDKELLASLQRAAVRQGCVVRTGYVREEWDDCAGYEEGASLEWLRRHGRL